MATITLEQEALAREVQWLLSDIKSELKGELLDAINTCQDLLSNKNDELKIVMSSTKSEVLKGLVTRNGAWISHCDIYVKCSSLTKKKKQPICVSLAEPYILVQLQEASMQVAEAATCIEHLDDNVDNPNEQSRLALLQCLNSIKGARRSLYAPDPSTIFPHSGPNRQLFKDLDNVNISVDFYIADSNIVTDLRTFEVAHNHDSMFLPSIFAPKTSPPPRVMYNGQEVIEHERIIVGNQDPTLISAVTKLTALESHLEHMVRKVQQCT